MRTQLCVEHMGRRDNGDDLATKIVKAVEENDGKEPTEIHFSSAQTTASGGQFGYFAALLVWRDPS